MGLDKLNDLNSGLRNVVHILSVRVLAEERGSANDNIDTVDARLDRNSSIVHVASDVCQDLELHSASGALEEKNSSYA